MVACVALAACQAPITRAVHLVTFPSHGKNIGFDVALERGYFRDEGIEVTMSNAFENALAMLDGGRADIAQMLCVRAMQAMEQGARHRIIAVRDAVLPIGTISLPAAAINTPADYAGKRWGEGAEFGVERMAMRRLGELTGFDPAAVRLVNMEYRVRLPALLAGNIDFVSAWWASGYPAQLIAARREGVSLRFLRWSDYGLDGYGDCLVARQRWLDNDPRAARAFLAAAARGFHDAIADPAAAVALLVARDASQRQQAEVITLAWAQAQDLLFDDQSRRHGLFWIAEDKLARTRQLFLGSDTRVPIGDTYSNDFQPSVRSRALLTRAGPGHHQGAGTK